jgi:hypothetical protein
MQNELQIKQFELREKEALFSFLREVYADNARQSDERFWHWHYCESPFAGEDNVPLWIAKHGEEIVGQLGAIPVELNVKGETQRAAWILDLIIRIDFRRHGLAKRLVLAINELYPTMLGVNTMEQHAPAMLQSLGWLIAGKIDRYSKLINPGNAAKEISGIKPLRAVINTAFAILRPAYPKNTSVKKIERFDESFDELAQKTSGQWKCAVVRNSGFLNWQYVDQPGKKFDILGYYKDEELRGYIVLFIRKKNANGVVSKAAITDISYHPEESAEIVDALLKTALNLAAEYGAGTLVTDIVDTLVEKRLQNFGFWRIKNPLQLMTRSEKDQDLIYDIGKWFITRGDSDISIFEDPNL